MAISDSEWQQWLESEDKEPVVLIEAGYYDKSERIEGVLYASDKGYVDRFDASAQNYLPLITSRVVIDDQLDASLISDIELFWINNELEGYQFIGFDVRVFYGDRSWPRADFRQQAYSKTRGLTRPKRDRYRFIFENMSQAYMDQLIDNVGLPFVFGYPFNVQPMRESLTAFVYYTPQVESYYGTVVRDRGVTLTTLNPDTDEEYSVETITGGADDEYKIRITLYVEPSGEVTCDPKILPFESPEPYISEIITQANRFVANPIPLHSSVADYDQTAGYAFYAYESMQTMLTNICDSIGANPRVNTDGELELVQINEPGDPVRAIGRSALASELSLIEREPPYTKLSLGFTKNWTIQKTNLAGSLSEDDYARFGTEYRYVSSTREQLSDAYPFSKPKQVDTVLDLYQANQELSRRFALRSIERTRWTLPGAKGEMSFLTDRLGQTITVTTDLFPDGEDFVVIGNRKDLTGETCELTVWK